jgi:hypothetical protein
MPVYPLNRDKFVVSGDAFITLFSSKLMNGPNNLRHWSMTGLSSVVSCLQVRPGAYPRKEHLESVPLR